MQSYFKILVVVMIVCLESRGLFSLQGTIAYQSNTETASSNSIVAGSISFSVATSALDPSATAANLMPGDDVTASSTLTNTGSLNFQYSAWSKQISGDDFLCQQLVVDAKLEGVSQYNGSVQVFNFATSTFVGPAHWRFDVSLPADPPEGIQNMTCTFAIVYGARQLGSVIPGFNDIHESDFTVTTGTWVSAHSTALIVNDLLTEDSTSTADIENPPLPVTVNSSGSKSSSTSTPDVLSPVDNGIATDTPPVL